MWKDTPVHKGECLGKPNENRRGTTENIVLSQTKSKAINIVRETGAQFENIRTEGKVSTAVRAVEELANDVEVEGNLIVRLGGRKNEEALRVDPYDLEGVVSKVPRGNLAAVELDVMDHRAEEFQMRKCRRVLGE